MHSKAKEILSMLYEQDAIGIVEFNVADCTYLLSSSMARMIGLHEGERVLSEKEWGDLIQEEDRAKFELNHKVHRASKGEIPLQLEMRFLKNEGPDAWLSCKGKVIYDDEGGNEIAVLFGFQDISRFKYLAEEVQALNSSISHDLRAPLRAIEGFCGILEEDYNDVLPKGGQNLIGIIVKNTVTLKNHLEGVLAISRIGMQDIQKERVALNDVVDSVFSRLMNKQDVGRDIQLTLGNNVECYVEVPLFEDLWSELLSNSIKFTQSNQKIILEVDAEEVDKGARISLQDNGVGFDPQYTHKVFRMFQKLHSEKDFEGAGLGLARVRKIVRFHGGDIKIKGVENGGTRIEFFLPN